LTEHLGTKAPTSVATLAPGMPRRRVRNRAVSSARLKQELDYAFRYPTYREGELAIDQELGVEGTTAAAAAPPMVIHRRAALSTIADQSGLRRLTIRHAEVAAGEETHIANPGEAVVQVVEGAVTAVSGEQTCELEAGDLVEVPSLGLQIRASDRAQCLIISTRR